MQFCCKDFFWNSWGTLPALFNLVPLTVYDVQDVDRQGLVHLVDEHEHVAVLFYANLDKTTKKVTNQPINQ